MPAPQSYVTLTIPHSLARTGTSTNPYQDYYNTYDYAIGGVPFRAEISPENPLIRSSAQFKKDQFDNGVEPGEQSLTGWWLRSQSSWHLGTGIVNSDVRLDETAEFRFANAEGVNPWIRGQMTLLRSMDLASAGGSSVLALGVTGSADGVLYANDNALSLVTDSGETAITWGGSTTVLSIASDGASWYAAAADGIYTGALVGTTTGSKLWTISAARCVLRWLKSRLIAGIDEAIYELVPPVGTAPHTLPAATYTHPNSMWSWTDMADGPSAIYAIGYHGVDSSILKLTLSTEGALPALTLATNAAELPRGETGRALYTYLGRYLMIGTSKGCRVAVIGPDGAIDYGPLIETPSSVRSFVAMDHYVWAGHSMGFEDGTSGALRIDLSEPLAGGRYPYAKDVMCHVAGNVMSVTTFGRQNRAVLAVAGQGLYVESVDSYETSGYFTTGRIRFHTLWPKLFKRLNVKADLAGPIAISSIDDRGNEVLLASISSASQQGEDLPINYPSTPQEFIQLRFTLSGDGLVTPVMRGYQAKALPGGPRPRRYVIPLRCYDNELGNDGVRSGYKDFGLERLAAVEALDSSGEVVLFQDLASNTAESVTIEQTEFRQVVAPQPGGTWGGILTVELRTLN